jgi:hypothetical protein
MGIHDNTAETRIEEMGIHTGGREGLRVEGPGTNN